MVKLTEAAILKALRTVIDPDLHKDIVSLGMVKNIRIESGKISFSVELTTPACPLKEMIRGKCTRVVEEISDEGTEIEIEMTSNVTTVRNDSPLLPGVKNIIAVASGKGGVGKSTIVTNLAIGLAKSGAKVGLIDADIFGPSIPIMFNCEFQKPKTKKSGDRTMILPIEKYGIKLISIGLLMSKKNAMIWRGPMASSALKQLIGDTEWGDLDYLMIDLPPGTSDIHLTLVQAVPVTGVIIVTTPQKVALEDARKGLIMFNQEKINVPILGIVENMSYFLSDENSDKKQYVFGQGGGKSLARSEKVPLIAQVPLVQSIRESSDEGFPITMEDNKITDIFMELSQSVASQVAIRNASKNPTEVLEIIQK
jgi:ATP-binding protein involved in chromosome partitioning